MIIRPAAIGDVVFATPLIAALRRAWPQSHIAWLAEPVVRELLAHHPGLNEVIVWDKTGWKKLWKTRQFGKLWREFCQFRNTLKTAEFDTVLDLQGLLKSATWAWLSGAGMRIGLDSREGSKFMMTQVIQSQKNDLRIGSEYLYLADALQLKTTDFRMEVVLDSAIEKRIEERFGEVLNRSPVVLCPFTTRPQKHWPEPHWRRLMTLLYKRLGQPIIMLGGPNDRLAAKRIQTHGVLNLAGETTLSEAAAIINRAALVIGVDTGLTHIGVASGNPTLALFGSTRPYRDAPGSKLHVVYRDLDCSPCRRRPSCNGSFDCMSAISAELVLSYAETMTAEP